MALGLIPVMRPRREKGAENPQSFNLTWQQQTWRDEIKPSLS
jgi:hypothetical protein